MWNPPTMISATPFATLPKLNSAPSRAAQDGFPDAWRSQSAQATHPPTWRKLPPSNYAQNHYSYRPSLTPPPPSFPPRFLPPFRQETFNFGTSTVNIDHSSSFYSSSYSKPPPPLPGMGRKKIMRPAPIPLPAYVAQAQSQPVLCHNLPNSRPLLVIIDLNGTILFRPNKRKPTRFTLRRDAEKFLDHLLEKHFVLVWSSARPHNVEAMANTLFAGPTKNEEHLLGIWGRDKLHLTKTDENRDVQVYKQLNWVWEDEKIRGMSRELGQSWDETNTLLLDDSALKAASHPFNWVEVPEWNGREEVLRNGSVLGQIVAYIGEASKYAIVSSWVREKPFVVDGAWESQFGMGEAEMEFSEGEEIEEKE
jgi:hypothetical protein